MAENRYRGVAPGVGDNSRIRAAKILDRFGKGDMSWMESAMDFMDHALECDSGRPQVINISAGSTGTGQMGTDNTSRKLDDKVWTFKQSYIVCSGNNGVGNQTIWSPGVAKNALTIGNVLDHDYLLLETLTLAVTSALPAMGA